MAKRGRKSMAEEKRTQILEAFRRCAVRNGLERTSLREVAEEAEVSLSMLHHYFRNRDEMVTELARRIVTGITERIVTEINSVKNPERRLKKAFDYLFSTSTILPEDGSLYYDFWSLAHRSQEVRQTFRGIIDEERRGYLKFFGEIDEFSGLSPADMKEISNIIIALLEGLFYLVDMDGENVSLKRMSRITRRFIEYYAKERSSKKGGK